MPRMFPLAGLLRLRQIQQDQAASDLAAARRRANESAARERRAQSALSGIATDVGDSSVLYAIAAARASSRSMLAELQEIERADRENAEAANESFTTARARSVGLEKLERRHVEGVEHAELRAEQGVLDEIANRDWKRPAEGLAL